MNQTPLTGRRLLIGVFLGALGLAVVLLGAILVNPAALRGPEVPGLPAGEAFAALRGGGEDVARAIVWRARMPRVLLAAVVGGALAGAGALLQVLLRNPLADPFVLGVSSGAALASVAGLAAGVSFRGGAHPVAGAVGALVAAVAVHRLARLRGGRIASERLVLAGVVLSYLMSAGVMWVVSLAPASEGQRYLFWLMGSLASASGGDVALGAVALAVGLGLALPVLPALNVLGPGESHATDSGVNVARVQAVVFVAAALLTGASVTVAGSIGFVGLVVPHVVRLLGGTDARLAVPTSVLGGAAFLVVADVVSRLFGEVPVGVVTATCGAPFFLFLLARRRTA